MNRPQAAHGNPACGMPDCSSVDFRWTVLDVNLIDLAHFARRIPPSPILREPRSRLAPKTKKGQSGVDPPHSKT